ncbi:MAG: prepilin-type N-terminal cleavage/methylation domain-containing protein, partial [Rhodocyclaceae bacterium]|nr:prepilin-type N-terminal cleavage/methylation domain-containing protein [Rhodocyclaceae bacterium]
MSKQLRGFTLVEVSLVLVIVSLMLASTVKAAEWVDVSKLRSLVEEFREMPMLVESYRSAFHQ